MTTVTTDNKSKPLAPAIRRNLDSLRGMIRQYVFSQLVIVLLAAFIISFWFFGAIDYLPVSFGASESPMAARAIMLILAGLLALYVVARWGVRKLWLAWQDRTLALLIERKFPEFASSLVTTVDYHVGGFVAADDDPELSDSMFKLTAAHAEETSQKIDVAQVLDWRRLRWQWTMLAVLVALSVGFALWKPSWTAQWSKRFFALSNEPWPRQTLIRADGIELEVPSFTGELERTRFLQPFRDKSVLIPRGREGVLRVSANTSKVVPEVCNISYRNADGSSGRAKMRRLMLSDDGWQRFTLDGPPFDSIDQDIDLSIVAGDMRLSNYGVQVVDGPLITNVKLRVTYPRYLQNTDTRFEQETLPYQMGMRIPEGSDVTLIGISNKQLERVEYVVSGGSDEESTKPEIRSVAVNDTDFEIELGAISANRLMEFRLWDKESLCSDRIQQYVLSVLPDELPTSELMAKGIGTAVTPIAMLPMQAKFDDDHGVRDGALELQMNQELALTLPVESAAKGQADMAIDLRELKDQGKLEVVVGYSLTLGLKTSDFFDLTQDGHHSRSAPLTLSVVTPDALLMLLEKREFAMRSRLEQMISELTQMRELLDKMQTAADSQATSTSTTSTVVQPPAESPNNSANGNDSEGASDPQRESRMQQLRAQQCSMQADKSLAELKGIEKEIGQIYQELINNRIDSSDRQERLETKIRQPIVQILDRPFPQLSRNLKELETVLTSQAVIGNRITANIQLTDEVLLMLQDVLKNMVDIQDFNEIVDMVRGILDKQDELLKKTKDEQKKQVLDLFK